MKQVDGLGINPFFSSRTIGLHNVILNLGRFFSGYERAVVCGIYGKQAPFKLFIRMDFEETFGMRVLLRRMGR